MDLKVFRPQAALPGLFFGAAAVGLSVLGNPDNMGLCAACFLRDTAGALGLHQSAAFQYIRPEIPALVLGSFFAALFFREFSPRGGSSPVSRFLLGFLTMVGCLMFSGCPLRGILRLAGGDGNAVFGLAGYAVGILGGVFFLEHGFSLGRTYRLTPVEGALFPAVQLILLITAVAAPAFFFVTQAGKGPGGLHAPLLLSALAGLLLGGLSQRSRLCIVSGPRDALLFHDWSLMLTPFAILIGALVCNLLTGRFHPGFSSQPYAHTSALWNAMGLLLAGFCAVLLGGCPLRQLIMAGEGNTDSAVTLLGLLAGASFAHNFGLTSSPAGPTPQGKAAVLLGLTIAVLIASVNTFYTRRQQA